MDTKDTKENPMNFVSLVSFVVETSATNNRNVG